MATEDIYIQGSCWKTRLEWASILKTITSRQKIRRLHSYDDISFVADQRGNLSGARAPSNVVVRPQQREMELSWNAIAEENVSYQIIMNGEKVATTEGTSYIVERLEPGKSYQFSVCSVKGGGYIGSFCSAHATDPTDEYGH